MVPAAETLVDAAWSPYTPHRLRHPLLDATWATTRRHLPLSSLLEDAEDARIERLGTPTVPIEQVNYLAGHKSMAMTKRYDHANEERYGGAIEALDEAGKTGSAEALAAAR